MKKYKVNNDKKKPSKKDVGKYKNFSRLKHRYDQLTKRPKKPLYKNPKFFLGLLLVLIILYLIFQSD
tara:strand:+ start:457 stop:657 length:201 start_codon:yes stop_codon:yes gene_type:complete